MLRIADFINRVVGTRKIPDNRKGAVVMKLDVEGREIAILADLIFSGALKHLNNLHFDPVAEKAELKQRLGYKLLTIKSK